MSWLLDTNTCSHVLRRRFCAAEKLRRADPSRIYVSAITVAEAKTGARKSPRKAQLLAAWDHFLSPFADRIVPFDAPAAESYAEIRAGLEQAGCMIGDRDCMIAAIARTHGLIVVTSNTDEFERVPHLVVEDWARE